MSLIVGDSFSEHPCTAKDVLPGKYGTRGSEVIVVSPETSRTAWFANRHLRCKPGGESAVAAGLLKAAAEKTGSPLVPDLKKLVDGLGWAEIERAGGVSKDALAAAAASMLGAAKVTVYLSNIFGRIGAPALAFSFAEALANLCPGDRKFVPQFVQQNTWGIYSVLAAAGSSDCLKKLASTELRAIIALGLDLFSVFPAAPIEKAMREKRFTATTQFFWNQTADRANVVIPAASLMEKKGTVAPAFGEELVREEFMPPIAGAVTAETFLSMLAKEMGAELGAPSKPARKTSTLRRRRRHGRRMGRYAASQKELDAAGTVLIPWSESVHAADGSLSRNFYWSQVTCPVATLFVPEETRREAQGQAGRPRGGRDRGRRDRAPGRDHEEAAGRRGRRDDPFPRGAQAVSLEARPRRRDRSRPRPGEAEPAKREVRTMEKRVYINMNLCTSCRSCAAACARGTRGRGT